MSSKIFRISAVAATIAASFGVQAAIYNVYEYAPVLDSSSDTYGVAIQQSSNIDCWGTDCSSTHATDHKIVFEEKRFAEGFQYRNEAPFLIEDGFDYLEEGYDGFDLYCQRYLDYAETLCTSWSTNQYTNGYYNEIQGDFANSLAYVESTQVSASADDYNTIVNSIDESGQIVGTYQVDEDERTRAFYGSTDTSTDLTNGLDDSVGRTRAWARLDGITVGSVSKTSVGYPTTDYISQAAIWDGSDVVSLIDIDGAETSRSMPQGSARDIAKVGTSYYAVGYNANSDEIPVASIFALGDDLTAIPTDSTTYIATYNDEDKYLNSLLTSVNSNGIAIGTAKNRYSDNGSFANVLFYVPDVSSSSSATFYSQFPSMFFSGANASAGGINNNDEVVGKVDYEKHQESNEGKPRSQRAFIASLSTNTQAPIGSNSYYFDDLTLGSNGLSTNNDYRIIDATDINDAGVVSGTAYRCVGGYETEAIDATCAGDLSLVAVKLLPIQGSDESQIEARPVTETVVERQGASFGFLALTILGFLGFRRK